MQIIFAFRDRDVDRVKLSLTSLKSQTQNSFNVIFIDYGSQDSYAQKVKEIVSRFTFVTYYYVGHPGLLWNKSKAINYGLRKAHSDFIITADVDVLFTENFVEIALKLSNPNSFSLFKIGYLSQQVTEEQQKHLNLKAIKTTHIGDTFGIGLFPKSTLEAVGGLDEFYHFYGSEDEDLNYRVLLFGATLNNCNELLLYHQWHERYPQEKDRQLTVMPRLRNVLRINQRHFLWHKDQKIIHPNPKTWGCCYRKDDAIILEDPTFKIHLYNISSHVEHFFGAAIYTYSGSVIQVVITEAPYFKSLKYQIKKAMGKQSQPYMTMKTINDLILKEIMFHYRDHNYAYEVSEDLKQVKFTINLDISNNDIN
ncbi:glycosyltransferase [Gelidibacter gilvus]|uniref:Glycosyltransferase n=1 Tax=Gelidibacter gilvus TaxID=59602 RepID=A0A4Q0XDM2_9FLAO|nr:glycosyltransferase [Gelidibacter gilvus]